jgi:hypothetical protein
MPKLDPDDVTRNTHAIGKLDRELKALARSQKKVHQELSQRLAELEVRVAHWPETPRSRG